jgi:hypothetical protein
LPIFGKVKNENIMFSTEIKRKFFWFAEHKMKMDNNWSRYQKPIKDMRSSRFKKKSKKLKNLQKNP